MADELAPEVVATASSRVAAALAKDNPPAPAASPQQSSLPGTAPAGEPATQAGEKRTRTTVAKLLQKYQERVVQLENDVIAVEEAIEKQQASLNEMYFKLNLWREAIAEINAD